MNNFVASNGKNVSRSGTGLLVGNMIFYRDEVDALREFFVAKQDEELGRWRSPDYPDYSIYPASDNLIQVVDEWKGDFYWVSRTSPLVGGSNMSRAAQAYFDAHPAPDERPWESAQKGEGWVLTIRWNEDFGTEESLLVSNAIGDFVGGDSYLDALDPRIIAGYRVYPIVSTDDNIES